MIHTSRKLETAITRSTANTRMRDFYDMHILLRSQEIDPDTLGKALTLTASRRGSTENMSNAASVLTALSESADMKMLWKRYQSKYQYAAEESWESILRSLRTLCRMAGLSVGEEPQLAAALPES